MQSINLTLRKYAAWEKGSLWEMKFFSTVPEFGWGSELWALKVAKSNFLGITLRVSKSDRDFIYKWSFYSIAKFQLKNEAQNKNLSKTVCARCRVEKICAMLVGMFSLFFCCSYFLVIFHSWDMETYFPLYADRSNEKVRIV